MIRAGPLLLVFFSGSEDGEGVKFKETGTGGDRPILHLSYTYPTYDSKPPGERRRTLSEEVSREAIR